MPAPRRNQTAITVSPATRADDGRDRATHALTGCRARPEWIAPQSVLIAGAGIGCAWSLCCLPWRRRPGGRTPLGMGGHPGRSIF